MQEDDAPERCALVGRHIVGKITRRVHVMLLLFVVVMPGFCVLFVQDYGNYFSKVFVCIN